MSQQIINTGVIANDGTGDNLRVAATKSNDNFTELYTLISALNTATSYTPTVTDSGGGRTYTTTVNSARYTQIGNLRWFTVDITVTAASGTASGAFRVSLPSTCTYACAAEIYCDNLQSSAKTDVQVILPASAGYAEVVHYENGDANSVAQHVQATSRLVISGVYFSAP
jgi:hypothetical protein